MRILAATVVLAAAAVVAAPMPTADAGGLFFRDRGPAYYAPPAPVYYAPAYRRDRMRSWCLFDWFRFDRWSRRW